MAKNKKIGYGGLEPEYEKYDTAKIVIVPIPYDKTSTWGKGADKGPDAIIDASANMELYDIETDSEVYKQGIFTEAPVKENKTPEKMIDAGRKIIKKHLDNNKFVVTIGGEHSITNAPIQAYIEKYKDFTVLQLDAHSDLRDEYHGSKYSHASIMARIKEKLPIVQVGIRSMDSSEKKNMDKSRVFFAKDIQKNNDWTDKAVKMLGKNVYITIDLDVFDPSILPSTGTPEPGGLNWYEVISLMRKVFKEKNVIGFDIVELAPNKEEKASDFLASKLIYTMLAYKFEK